MASPTVDGVATTDSSSTTTSAVVTLPSSITDGNTLIMLIRTAGTGGITTPSGWTELDKSSIDASDDTVAVYWKKAASEGSTVTVTTGDNKFTAIVYDIAGATDPTVTAPDKSTAVGGDSSFPDPFTVTPAGGSKDYLFLWLGTQAGKSVSPPVSPLPSGYLNRVGGETGGGGPASSHCRVFTCDRQLTASSEDPGSWETSQTEPWIAWTAAIHPAPAVVTRRIFNTS